MSTPEHLGLRVTALVDGELGHDERDRALAHLAACSDCRQLADHERRVKARLSSMRSPAVAADLSARLLALAAADVGARGAAPAPRARAAVGGSFTAPVVPRASFTAPAGRGPTVRPDSSRPGSRRRRRPTRWLAGGGSVALLTLGAVLMLGAPSDRAVVDPGQDRFMVEHVATSTEVPFSTAPVGPTVLTTYRR